MPLKAAESCDTCQMNTIHEVIIQYNYVSITCTECGNKREGAIIWIEKEKMKQ